MPLECTTPKPTPVPAPRCVNPIPVSPQLSSLGRSRRPSTRQSFSSVARSNSNSEFNRTLCAKDNDSYSYDSAYLKEWYMSGELWSALPVALRDSISVVQHAGAAVLTGFERLEELKARLIAEADPADHDSETHDDITSAALKVTTLSLSEHDHESLLSDQDEVDSIPASFANRRKFSGRGVTALNRARSDSVFSSFVVPSSLGSSPSPPVSGSSTPLTPMSPLSKPMLPVSITLPSPATSKPASNAQSPVLSGQRTFHLPPKPLTAYYRVELQHLKSDSLVRLRHAARKVDVEMNSADGVTDEVVQWWIGIKAKIDYILTSL